MSTAQPCRATPKAAEAGPNRAPNDPLGTVPGVAPGGPSLRAFSGAVSPALVPALGGCAADSDAVACTQMNLRYELN